MRNKAALALASIALAFAAVALAGGPINEEHVHAPEISADRWINSRPLAQAGLHGKVVLIDFWDYTRINCIRTLPYLRLWNRLYAPLGLVIIGVHTPEFAFAKNPEQVAAAVKHFGLEFPVAVDSDRRTWKAFHNEGWPCAYLIDKDGALDYSHCGEGDYADLERLIQQLLKQANPKLDFSSARFTPHADSSRLGPLCKEPSPEIFLGYMRADDLANPEGYRQLAAASYRPVAKLPLDQFDISGQWLAMPENVKNAAAPAGYDRLQLHYRAKSVYLVAGSDDGQLIPIVVTQDGRPIGSDSRGADIRVEADGQTYLPMAGKRMYYLVDNRGFGEHVLSLQLDAPGGAFYSFSFGGSCEPALDHP